MVSFHEVLNRDYKIYFSYCADLVREVLTQSGITIAHFLLLGVEIGKKGLHSLNSPDLVTMIEILLVSFYFNFQIDSGIFLNEMTSKFRNWLILGSFL